MACGHWLHMVFSRVFSPVLPVTGWVFGNMIPFFYLLKVLNFLRVPAEDETLGLDASMHGVFQWTE